MVTTETSPKAARTVRVLCSEPEIVACRKAWERLQQHPNADWGFFGLINHLRNEIESPCIFELSSREEVRSLWAGRLERARLPLRLGYLRLGTIPVRCLSIITGGTMGDDSLESCRELLAAAQRVLVAKRLDFILLSYLPCEHPLFKLAARDLSPWYCRDWGVIPSTPWRMTLPASFGGFLAKRSKKHTYWLKRLPRVLEEAFPGQVSMRVFRAPSEVTEFCRDSEAVSRLTYQHQLGESLRADRESLARCMLLAENGSLRGYILYVKNEPAAYWLATAFHSTLHLNLTGYNPELKKFEIGTVLLLKLFADHCGTGIEKVDFGLGGALYKERFGDESFTEASVRIYRACPRSLFINAFSGGNERVSAGMRALLQKLGVLQKVKTLWRARLSAQDG